VGGALARRFARARTVIGGVGLVLFGIALVVFLVVSDVQLIDRAVERSESALSAVVLGAAGALGTVFGTAWYRWRVDDLGPVLRRALGWVGIAWSVAFVVAFAWTHAVDRDDESPSPAEAGVAAYVLLIILAAVGFLPFAVRMLARPRAHEPHDRVRVWDVQDEEPFFIAYCDCGWVGTAYDATDPDAREKAFRDAHRHGPDVEPEVEQPL
jgi:MFS family permease